jgi:hypothetical protein
MELDLRQQKTLKFGADNASFDVLSVFLKAPLPSVQIQLNNALLNNVSHDTSLFKNHLS